MTKKTGFIITATYFVPIDKKDFAKQAAAYATMAEIDKSGTLPDDFAGSLLSVKAKQGSADVPDVPDAPAASTTTERNPNDPASWPLTTEPLPADATVISSDTDLAGHIFQTIRLVDGTETFRRMTAEQNQAELDAAGRLAEATGKTKTK